jgi:hypothetical protein
MATPGNGEFRGRERKRKRKRKQHRPGPDFSGHNEGATKCTGARARPEPRAAKAEPPGHKSREACLRHTRYESGCSSRGFPISYETIGTKQLLTRGSLLRMEWAPSRRVGAASKGQLGN